MCEFCKGGKVTFQAYLALRYTTIMIIIVVNIVALFKSLALIYEAKWGTDTRLLGKHRGLKEVKTKLQCDLSMTILIS